jgi:hypothetical protein
MEFTDGIELIRHTALAKTGISIWADLGSGSGLFTYALAYLLPEGSVIYAIDKKQVVPNNYPQSENSTIIQQQADFIIEDLSLPGLDGILMANSLHYVQDKGSFLIVEYNTEAANRWVPYPVSFNTLKNIFKIAGYSSVTKLREKPSLYGRANLYAAYISR